MGGPSPMIRILTIAAILVTLCPTLSTGAQFGVPCKGDAKCIADKLVMEEKNPLGACAAECRERCRRGVGRNGEALHFTSVQACIEYSAAYGRGRTQANAIKYNVR